MLGMIGEWLGIITGVVCAASIICALTPTPKDDAMIGKLYNAQTCFMNTSFSDS